MLNRTVTLKSSASWLLMWLIYFKSNASSIKKILNINLITGEALAVLKIFSIARRSNSRNDLILLDFRKLKFELIFKKQAVAQWSSTWCLIMACPRFLNLRKWDSLHQQCPDQNPRESQHGKNSELSILRKLQLRFKINLRWRKAEKKLRRLS